MNWSKDFFNNVSKHFFIKSTVEPELIEFFKSLGVMYTSHVMEQCCGEGQLQIALNASLGCKTLGVDQCDDYIKTALKRAKEAQVTTSFMQYDILTGKCVGLVHFVINWNTSWGYFEDDALNLKFLQNAHMHLRKNGKFVLEYYNSAFVKNNFEPFREISKEVDGQVYTCERTSRIENNCLLSDCVIKDSEQQTIFNSAGLTKMYSSDEISAMLLLAGFQDVVCYADLNKNTPTDSSPRLIFVAKK